MLLVKFTKFMVYSLEWIFLLFFSLPVKKLFEKDWIFEFLSLLANNDFWAFIDYSGN